MITSIKKTISIYAKLTGWWLHHREPRIPSSLSFNNQNNPFGYDWAWAVLDNGWTIFYGNLMFWLMKGPAAGTLILSKDDRTYEEFCNIRFEYNKMRYMEEYDVYYPSEIKVAAEKNQQKICLCFTMTNECRMFINKFPRGKYWLAFIIFEAPGKVTGYYSNGNKRTKLSGFCKVEPQRQISTLGYNALHLDVLLPPEGLGTSFVFDSHFFKKRLNGKLELLPRPKTKFHIEKLCK